MRAALQFVPSFSEEDVAAIAEVLRPLRFDHARATTEVARDILNAVAGLDWSVTVDLPGEGAGAPAEDFQAKVARWMLACFGAEIAADITERNHRFLEEALELVQAKGCTADEAHQLVDYVFDRPKGAPVQEVGGVMVTLAALCDAAGIDMDMAAQGELGRIWTKVEQIRAKQAAKPKFGPLPGAAE